MRTTLSRLPLLIIALGLLALSGALTSCETSDGGHIDGESRWLLACASDADCGSDLQCFCGACTRACAEPGEECEEGVACVPAEGLEPTAACEASDTFATSGMSGAARGTPPTLPGEYLCLPVCGDDAECAGRRCGEIAACLPPDVEGSRSEGGGSGTLVCDQGQFPQEGECFTCHELKEMHLVRLTDEVSESMYAPSEDPAIPTTGSP